MKRKIWIGLVIVIMLVCSLCLFACEDLFDDNSGSSNDSGNGNGSGNGGDTTHTHSYENYYCVGCDGYESGYAFSDGLLFDEIEENGVVTAYSLCDRGNAIGRTIVIPEYYKGKPVTAIDEYAFSQYRVLTHVVIPATVTRIGFNAFGYCYNLTSVTIAENSQLTSIGDGAFRDCHSLTIITIPNGVTSIGDLAFLYCSSLTSITIPQSVTSIGDSAFSSCSSLTSITIPNSVTSIGNGVFSGCSSLTSVIFTENSQLTSIGSGVFSYCSSLTSITIPNSVTSIGESAFSGCSSLTIYCEAESQPSGWDSGWNSSNRPVVWGYQSEQ